MSGVKKLTCAGVLVLILLHVLPIHQHPFRMYWQDAMAISAIVALFLVQIRVARPGLALPGWLLGLPVLLILVILLQTLCLRSSNLFDLYWPLLYFAVFALSQVVGSNLDKLNLNLKQSCELLAWGFVLAGGLSVFMQISQLLAWDLRPFVMSMPTTSQLARPFANVAQPNQLALLCCIGLAALYWWQQTSRFRAPCLLSLALWLIIGLVLTQSRIAWIILPIMGLAIVSRERKNHQLQMAVFFLLFSYVILLSQLDWLAHCLGYSGALTERLEGRSERKILWLQALRMIQEHPWLGVGWAGFGPAQVAMAAEFTPSIYSEHAHNLVLNLAAEIGIPATLLICASLAYWCLAVFPKLWPQAEVRFLGLCLMAVAVHSMVEFPLWYGYILFPVGLMMGILHQMRWPSLAIRMPAYSAPVLSVMAVVAMIFVSYDYLRVVNVFRAYQSQPSGQIIRSAELRQPAWTLFPQFYHYFDLLDFKPRPGLTQAQLDELAYWTRRFGFVHTLNTLAESYLLNQQIPAARRTMLTLYSLHPWRYAEYYDYWQSRAVHEPLFAEVLQGLPDRNAAQ